MKLACIRRYRREQGWRARWRYRRLPADLASWLLDETSLTRRLRSAANGDFHVEVIAQSRRRPLLDERALLGLSAAEWALVREVWLYCAGRPWVFARTIMPMRTLRGAQRHLAHLGTRPLGEALFTDHHAVRGPLHVLHLRQDDALHAVIGAAASEDDALWGRRSLFWFDQRPLLVSEIFLPEMRRQLRQALS